MSLDLRHDYPFDPRFGMTLGEMLALQPPPPPERFDAFWSDTYQQTRASPLQLEQEGDELHEDRPEGRFAIRTLRYFGWAGVELGAWLIVPADQPPRRFIVVGHGYYNRPMEDCTRRAGTAQLFIACRGLGLSRQRDVSDQTAFHVLHGIDHREGYIHRGCVADTWTGASVMLALFPQAAGQLEYLGGSFGGGIGAMALPWDDRYVVARLDVPSFGNQPWRLQHRCTGSGEAVRQKYLRHPEIAHVLRFYDSAIHATRIRQPTFCGCALFDPAVPPPGQFTVYNAISSEKQLFVRQTGHHDWPGIADENAAQTNAGEAFVARALERLRPLTVAAAEHRS